LSGVAGGAGSGPQQPVLLRSARHVFVETIGRGRRGTAMAAFSAASPAHATLSPLEIEAIVAFIRSWEEKS
jgi:mono/diheme cytochrome c family protein